MGRPRIAIATCAELPRLTADDRSLAAALAARGVEPVAVAWNAAGVAWGGFDGCLLRSTWDYPDDHPGFLRWARQVADSMPLWNGFETVAWNLEKTYLRELAAAGVPTIPTRWLRRGGRARLDEELAAAGWEVAVLKPVVDVGARRLRRVRAGEPASQAALDSLQAEGDVMVQPFLPAIEAAGELSLVYVEGRFGHAVRKRPAAGDFRVQPSWGGSVEGAEPGRDDLAIAELALAQAPEPPLYARVDLVAGPGGGNLVIELELIEPLLFLAQAPRTVEALAEALLLRIDVDAERDVAH